jgi:hypothetical protein
MMDLEKAVRVALAREVAPLLSQCEKIRAEIDRTEGALPIVLDKCQRAAAHVDVIMRRAELEAIISELQGNDLVEKVTHLVRERRPQWRI